MRHLPRRAVRLVCRELESRVVPTVSVGLSGSVASFLGDGSDEHLVLSTTSTGHLRHNLAGNGGLETMTDLDPAPGVQERLYNALTSLSVNLEGGTDTLDITRVATGATIANVEALQFALAESEAGGDVTLTNNALTVNDVPMGYLYALSGTTVTRIVGGSGENAIDASLWTGGGLALYGQAGHDTLRGGSGNDHLEGHAGNDTLVGNDGNDNLDFTNFLGSEGNDTLQGGAGHDNLGGGLGDDTLEGGSGNDTLSGNAGNDHFAGGSGTDRLEDAFLINAVLTDTTYTADGIISPGHGCETGILTGSDAANIIDLSAFTGPGGFIVYGLGGDDLLLGGAGDDTLDAADGNDTLHGGAGHDVLGGGSGHDTLDAGPGNDSLFGHTGFDHFSGGPGLDRLDDLITGNATLTDTTYTADGVISENHGCEYGSLTGSAEANIIDLSAWNGLGFALQGGGGDDVLRGGAGNDLLQGDDGNDLLSDGPGVNALHGGHGVDGVHLHATAGPDRILVAAGAVSINGVATTFDTAIESLTIDAGAGNDEGVLVPPTGPLAFTVLHLEPTVSLGEGVVNADATYLLQRPGSFQDIGAGQSWTAQVDYGAGAGFEPLAVDGESRTFVLNHSYDESGDFPVRVRVIDNHGNIGESMLLVQRRILIDVGGPQRSMVDTLSVAFDDAVTLAPGWYTFEKLSAGLSPTVAAQVQSLNGKTVVALSFAGAGLEPNGSLQDGHYRLTLHGTQIQGAGSASDFAYDFHRLFADANGDRLVDGTDLAIFGNAFGQTAANSPFDSDGNGLIDGTDFAAFGNRFGLTL